jgi:ABC-type transport system involved in cytochrome c biogenesis permease component
MSFLPVVQRELLVASRKRATFWSRTASAGLLLAFCVALFMAYHKNGAMMGAPLLLFLSSAVFIECMLAGVRYTCDCLSEEKREGTLGLLFLTNLTGLDVVLGKMIARSLNAVYNLLAVIPVLALPMMIGGVSGGQVAALSIVLLVSTLFSLSAGALISSRGLRERTVLAQTLLLLIGITVMPRLISDLGAGAYLSFFRVLPLVSPLNAFIEAGRGWVPQVQGGCWTVLGLSVASVGYAGWRIRRLCGEPELDLPPKLKPDQKDAAARRVRAWLLSREPLLWLALRGRTTGKRVFAFCGFLLLFGLFCRISIEQKWNVAVPFVIFGSYGLHAFYKFLVAAETSRQLNEDRRSGALELLLATPIHPETFVRAQMRATWRTWLPAAACLAAMNITWMTEHTFQRDMGVLLPCSLLLLFADSHTLAWRALANAIKGERFPRTVFRTFFQVIIPPLAFIVLLLASVIGGPVRNETIRGIFGFWTVVSLVYDIVLIAKARAHLREFRRLSSGDEPHQRRNPGNPAPQPNANSAAPQWC